MNKCEIIKRLKNIAGYAVHTVGEEPFVMSLDDGIAVHEAIELLKKSETNCSEIPNNWIPCSERLPEEGEAVLTQAKFKDDVKMAVSSRIDYNYWTTWGDKGHQYRCMDALARSV